MVTFREALEGAATAAICGALDTLGGAAAIFADLVAPFPGQQRYEYFANAFRAVCNDDPPDYEAEALPFEGLQCPIRYQITVTYRPVGGDWRDPPEANTSNNRIANIVVWGEVQAIAPLLQATNPAENSSTWAIRIRCRGAAPFSFTPRQPTFVDVLATFAQVVKSASGSIEIVNISSVPLDGASDNCGNPPPVIPPPPPGYNNPTINVTYNNNDGLDITVPVAFFVGVAYINASAQVEIPINFTINANVSFPITFNLSTGGFTLNWQPTFNNPDGSPTTQPPGGSGSGTRPDDYTFDDPPPPPPSGDEFDDVEEPENPRQERVIRAVAVTASIADSRGIGMIEQSGGNPTIYPPDLGMIQFKIRIGDSVFWTNNQRVLNERAFIECPWIGGAIDVQGTPRSGVQWFLTPVYGRSELANVPPPS